MVGGRVIVGKIIDLYSYNMAFIALIVVGIVAIIISLYNYRLDKKIFPRQYIVLM